ncbi:MAG TPA: thioesterase family protein [Nannocystis sp.]
MNFSGASEITESDAGLRWQVPDGWQQGRGAFGGLVLATLLRAIERAEPDRVRTVRSLTGDLCGPVLPGPAALTVEVLRRGNNLSNIDARLVQDGQVQARASAVLSAPRAHATLRRPPVAPEAPAWRDLPDLGLGPPVGPAFAPHFEYRSAIDFTTADGSETLGWLRLRRPPATLDAAAVVAMLDAWWPAIFSGGPRPMATVSFTAELLGDPAELAPDVPLLYRGRVIALHEGFCVEFRELWDRHRLVAMNQQTFAILR